MKALGLFFLCITSGLTSHEALFGNCQNTVKHPYKTSDPPVYQVIISEIMADPVPQVKLPENEYIEIFNRGTTAVDLTGWKLLIGNYEREIPDAIIAPGEYRIVCETEVDSLFTRFGNTLLISNMPPILNSGQTITLKTLSGVVIHSITFSDRWFNTRYKAEGGWSLEIIDPDNPCGNYENWSESHDTLGGSPGTKNSVYAKNPDHQSPIFLRATLPSDSNVLLHFSEPMEFTSLSSVSNYSINNGLLHPKAVHPVEPYFSSIVLAYAAHFKPESHYTITLLNSLKDCAGNTLADNAVADFALSQPPESFDVVFNEILFNPQDGNSEFIELFNRSKKVVDLSAFSIALADSRTGIIEKNVLLDNNAYILFPGSYVVITNNAHKLPINSFLINPSVILEQPDMFSLPNEEGFVVLLDTSSQTIDEFHYNCLMHDEMLAGSKGVSLERINPDNPSSDPENWHSASTTSGYATPGFRNSQMILSDDTWSVTMMPEVFSPDNDGVDDLVTLHLQLNEPGWKATITVFDANGRNIKNLITNSMLGTDEYFIWDGKWTDGRSADLGVYIIYGELFSPNGKTKNFKKVIPLVRKL
jgi:hypothetical protein